MSDDFEPIWPIFHESAAAGETCAYPREEVEEMLDGISELVKGGKPSGR